MRLARLATCALLMSGCNAEPESATKGDGRLPWKEAMIVPDAKSLDTYDDVVSDIVVKLDEESKALLRRMKQRDLIQFHDSWGRDIRNAYKLWFNEKLRRSCAQQCNETDDMDPEGASGVIMDGVWRAVNGAR
jgi:hypothetical protein